MTAARFPEVARDGGHYESFYLKAAHPSEPRAVWIRYTVWKAPGSEPVGSLWCTLFDASWEQPAAWKQSLPAPTAGDGAFVSIGDARFGPGVVVGPHWALSFEGDEDTFPYLPRPWMYRARVPRTKAESLYPRASFSGSVELGGRRFDLDGWPGMIGHNWGAEHAERWIWMHGAGLDVTIGRIKVGPLTVPWVANGFVEIDGRRLRVGGIERIRSTRVNEAPDRCTFALPGADGLVVDGELLAPRPTLVAWVYSDPGGGQHHTVHSSIADLRLVVRKPDRELTQLGGATYELGMRETTHGVPVQPFSDP